MDRSARNQCIVWLVASVLGCVNGPAPQQAKPIPARSDQTKPLPAQAKASATQSIVSTPTQSPKVGSNHPSTRVDGGAKSSESTSIATDVSNGYALIVWLKRPYAPNAKQLVSLTKLRFHGKVQEGALHTYVTDAQLKDIFGLNIRSWTDKGAGNSIGADAHHFVIQNKRILKPNIRILISDIELCDDPKWGLYDEDEEYRLE